MPVEQTGASAESAASRSAEETGHIRIGGLRKEYDDVTAVADFDIEIRPGEFITLVGPSGCGKTTTLRCVSGLETPTDGDIFIDGERVTDLTANKRNTSMVFQEWALFPHMTVKENIAFGLEMDNVPKPEREERVTEVLELVELPGYGDRSIGELSGGQKQRVAMARAIVREPDVLLLDEPLASLDRGLRQRMQVELKDIQEQLGITFLYVTHDQEAAMTMSDRIAVMNEGRLEQVGPPTELYDHPETTFVATFLGETNLLTGVTTSSEEGLGVDTGTETLAVGDSGFPPGVEVGVSVRPENVTLTRPGGGDELANRYRGTVDDVIYKGATTKYVVDIGTRTLVAQRQKTRQESQFQEGEAVVVGFEPSDCELIEQ
ncbi:ABC transporter ATP-binding protein [Halegenticoccus soli]|uniref:ABC transporter ATP-binding protein n=1 Tax=Halegenticoccus soli TaxID=1985678 RepID=UPI000C6D9D3A|nr:ABC transporter ATP-binding protein [Halegenticoccus soli]